MPASMFSRECCMRLHRLIGPKCARRNETGINLDLKCIKFIKSLDELFLIGYTEFCKRFLIRLKDQDLGQNSTTLMVKSFDGV